MPFTFYTSLKSCLSVRGVWVGVWIQIVPCSSSCIQCQQYLGSPTYRCLIGSLALCFVWVAYYYLWHFVCKTGILWDSLRLTLLEIQNDHFLLSTWGPAEQIYENSVTLPQAYPPACWSSLSWCGLQAMNWRTHGQIRETRTVQIGEHSPVVAESTVKVFSDERRKTSWKKYEVKRGI